MTPQDLGDALAALRDGAPQVQCLTNIVVAGWTANVLLAVGAAPAMVDNPMRRASSPPSREACWLTRVTGGGCALGALMAAFAAVVPDAVVAASAATSRLTVAAEAAAARSRGPGSFAVVLLDEPALIEPADLTERVRIS